MSARGDDAVSDVVGNILLVGITVAVMAGMSLAVLAIGGPEDTLHADLRVDVLRGGSSWGDGDEAVRLRHVGGEPVPVGVEVTVVLDGVPTTFSPADQGFADGALRMGQSWSATLAIPEGAEVSVVVIDRAANALVASTGVLYGATTGVGAIVGGGGSGGGSGGGGSVFTYVASGTATVGTLADLADAQSSSDGGAGATLTEAQNGTTAPTTATLDATTSSGVTDHANVLLSDDVRARFSGSGDSVQVEGFTLPADATVTGVLLGFEGQRSGGGAASAQLTLTYDVAGVAGGTSLSATVSDASDTKYTADATGDRAWTPQNVADLRLRLVRDSLDAGVRDADVDHVFVRVTYTVPATDLVATFDFEGVPATGSHQLQLRHSTSNDTFDIQVWSGSSWTTRGTLTSTVPATFTHTLTIAEHNGGAPRLRFLDRDTGVGVGVLAVDYARVVST